jgi:hypothetical protein
MKLSNVTIDEILSIQLKPISKEDEIKIKMLHIMPCPYCKKNTKHCRCI